MFLFGLAISGAFMILINISLKMPLIILWIPIIFYQAMYSTVSYTHLDVYKRQLIIQLGLNHVNLIKIDIEGYELFALKGLRSVLNSKNAPDIIFEFIDYAEESNSGVSAGSCLLYTSRCV